MKIEDEQPNLLSVLMPILNPLLSMLLPRQQSLAVPDEQIKLLGSHFRDVQMNNPENAAEVQYEIDDPSGKLGRMLTDDERRMLMQLIQRRITP